MKFTCRSDVSPGLLTLTCCKGTTFFLYCKGKGGYFVQQLLKERHFRRLATINGAYGRMGKTVRGGHSHTESLHVSEYLRNFAAQSIPPFPTRNIYGHIAALTVVTIWGTTFVSSKVLLNAGLMPADIFFVRFVMAYVMLLAVCHRRLVAASWQDELALAGLGVTGGSLYFLTENMALLHSTSANVSILVSATPLLTAFVVAAFYRDERLTRRQLEGSLVAFAGGILVVLNGQLVLHLNPLGDALAIGAALTWAFYSLLMRRVMGRYPADFITRKVFFYGVVTILPYFLLLHPLCLDTGVWLSPVVLGNVLFLGIIASTGCYLAWNWVMRSLGAVKPTNYIYLQSLVTMLAGNIVLGERITPMGLTGAVVLIAGMVVAMRK